MRSEISAVSLPQLSRLIDIQIKETPHHEKFLRRRFQDLSAEELSHLEELAQHVAALIEGAEEEHVQDYDWICQTMLEEELNFRRTGRYRLTTFADAYEQVYSRREYMTHYMNGLLMTQLWWSNHSQSMAFYRDRFIARNKDGYSHLEIGPGHGLFLYFAAKDPRAGSVCGWEISEASLKMTEQALGRLGLKTMPALQISNFLENSDERFDSIVFSEVLEHMEDPAQALASLRPLLTPEGRLFINVPINSPAPDHLFNMDTPEAMEEFIAGHGFQVVDREFFPATNQALSDARKKKLTISCAFVVQRAN
jgi:2-polyprenyl-3-methyl-5-hydroxy-6-metoxy-1,4-benzoquinol methylase